MRTIDFLFAGIVGLAIVAVVLGKNSQSTNALNDIFTSLTSMVKTIVKPVGGAK